MKLDPITLEILGRKVAAAADEMFFTVQRTSRSTYVKEACDFGTALVDTKGFVFGYPPSATVQFLIDSDCMPMIRAAGDLQPGDVIISNDPYTTEGLVTHLPDIHLLQPYFEDGRIVAYGWTFIHFTDVGGRVPSSISPSSHDVFQEGLRIPPMKLMRAGAWNHDLVAVFTANCRTPEINMGDIRAMLGGLGVGERRLHDIAVQHGADSLVASQGQLQDYTAEKARAVLRRIPDGDYPFWDFMDDDMVSNIPLRVRVNMSVRDGRVTLDVSGSDPQVAAAYNVPTMGKRNYWMTMRLTTFMTSHDQTMAMNVGLYRTVDVINPPGTHLNAEFPDAIGIRQAPARRLNDALTGSILKAAPDMMSAPTCGASAPLVLAETDDSGNGRSVQVLEPLRGGMGAMKGQDGVDARDNTLNNMKNHPLETVESDAGVVIIQYDVRPDSGGPGRWRGGVAQAVGFRFLRDGGSVFARGMERLRFPPWGVGGGRPGAPFRAIFNQGMPDERPVFKIDELRVNAGNTLHMLLPGGSGYGDPFLRDPARVLDDVEQGFVTEEGAGRDHGVILTAGAVDGAATKALRTRRVRDNVRADFDFGPDREAWESVFDDHTMYRLNRALMTLPKSVRQARRRWIFDQVLPDLPVSGSRPVSEIIADPDVVRARLAEAMAEVFGDTTALAAQ